MARLLRPVMMRMSVSPACTASSTTYWIAGLSTTGSISLGELFVAGRNRVPIPAAGITALRTLDIRPPVSGSRPRAEIDLLVAQQAPDVGRMPRHDEHRERGDRSHLPVLVAGQEDEYREEHRREQRRE